MDPNNNIAPNPTPTPEPAAPAPEPTAPAAPAAPVTPDPAAPGAPAAPNPTPVNPVVTPGANPVAANPAFQSGGPVGLSATEPIMRPEPAKAPDPIEEELKAPMKAAAPAPGSIGSAVSGPEGGAEPAAASEAGAGDNPFANQPAQTPNVSFNDPAAQPDANNPTGAKPAGKKTNKKTLIALIIVAVMVVIALAAVLVMQLMPSNPSSSATPATNNQNNSSNTTNGSSTNTDVNGGMNNNSSSTNTQNGTVTPTTDAASIAIVCSASYAQGTNMMDTTMTFQISNNVLNDITVSATMVDADGNSSSATETRTFQQILGNNASTQNGLIDAEGKLLVSVSELSTKLQDLLNAQDSSTGYVCDIL